LILLSILAFCRVDGIVCDAHKRMALKLLADIPSSGVTFVLGISRA